MLNKLFHIHKLRFGKTFTNLFINSNSLTFIAFGMAMHLIFLSAFLTRATPERHNTHAILVNQSHQKGNCNCITLYNKKINQISMQ
jgi:hypothetical protein